MKKHIILFSKMFFYSDNKLTTYYYRNGTNIKKFFQKKLKIFQVMRVTLYSQYNIHYIFMNLVPTACYCS